jgi:hypothetical protein
MAGGIEQRTGHPVIMIVIITDAAQAIGAFRKKVADRDMKFVACIFEDSK